MTNKEVYFPPINLHLSIYYPNIAGMKEHTMNPVDEKIIIERLKTGDNDAYKYLYDHHYVALCKISYYMLKDKVQAESIVSDVIFHLWEVRENLQLTPPLRNYLIVAVRNKCLNYLALKQQEVEIRFSAMEREGIQLQNIIPDNQQPLGTLLKKELEHKIQEAIQKLPPVCKQVFMMSRFREMSYEEISQELGISINTVKYHIKSALVILKRELGTFLCIFLAFYPTLLF